MEELRLERTIIQLVNLQLNLFQKLQVYLVKVRFHYFSLQGINKFPAWYILLALPHKDQVNDTHREKLCFTQIQYKNGCF